MSNIAIVGAGKVGTVLGRILAGNGENIVCVVSRTLKSAKVAGRFLNCPNCSDSLEAIPQLTDLILIATPHAAIAKVAQSLSQVDHLRFKRLSVCHASGMLTADVLEPLRKNGATVFSFHPLQTFPRDFRAKDIVPTIKGIYYAVDGTPTAVRRAARLARKLRGKAIEVAPEMRPFYHASCVVASNHLTTVLSILETMHRALRLKEKDFLRMYKPILMATLRNIEATSPEAALTGPVARGGVETVAGHFAAVRKFAPELLPYFGTLTLETAKLARAKGSLSREQALALQQLVQSQTNLQTEEMH